MIFLQGEFEALLELCEGCQVIARTVVTPRVKLNVLHEDQEAGVEEHKVM